MAHKTEEELESMLILATTRVKVGETYFHYKNLDKYYKVTALAFLEATEEVVVIYTAMYGKQLTWVRPLESFCAIQEDGMPKFTLAPRANL